MLEKSDDLTDVIYNHTSINELGLGNIKLQLLHQLLLIFYLNIFIILFEYFYYFIAVSGSYVSTGVPQVTENAFVQVVLSLLASVKAYFKHFGIKP